MENTGKILPGNHERGWNDPPQFLYDAQKQAGSISQTNPLASNKRVGHDLATMAGSSHTSSGVQHTGTAPPTSDTAGGVVAPPSSLTHVPILNMPSKEQTSHAKGDNSESLDIMVPDISDDTELCQYCTQCFTECAQRLQQQNVIDDRLAKDVIKRIGMFEKSWKSSKISDGAKPKCAKLSRALELEAYKQADEIHLQLMTDHISEVSLWIVGIKKLIQSALNKN